METGLINALELTYPPVSAQELEWVGEYQSVREHVAGSSLYVIGQREQVRFENFRLDGVPETEIGRSEDEVNQPRIIQFDLASFKHRIADVALHVDQLDIPDGCKLELGPKLIRFSLPEEAEARYWWTADRLLRDRWRGIYTEAFEGLDDYRVFTSYFVHYIGIATNQSALKRLVQGHNKYARILANEHPFEPGMRVSDEIIIFLFGVREGGIRTVGFRELLKNGSIEKLFDIVPSDGSRSVRDAEKALVHVLRPTYNDEQYRNYPKSKDGLHNQGYEHFSIAIAENLTFTTQNDTLRGSYGINDGHLEADSIIVRDGKIKIFRNDA